MNQSDLFARLRETVLAAWPRSSPACRPRSPPASRSRRRDPAHGDMATNAAMVSAKAARQPPAKLAAALAAAPARQPRTSPRPRPPDPASSTSACDPDAFRALLPDHPTAGGGLRRRHHRHGHQINVEYVSANPTGPMHIGHCRGAVVGDALANLLAKAGYEVTKEYYINDAGAQVTALAWAAYWRYLQAIGTAADGGRFRRRSPRRPAIPRRISRSGRRGAGAQPRHRLATPDLASPRRTSGSTPCATSPSTP